VISGLQCVVDRGIRITYILKCKFILTHRDEFASVECILRRNLITSISSLRVEINSLNDFNCGGVSRMTTLCN